MIDPAVAGANSDDIAQLGDIAAAAGLRRIAILAWRDIDDPEAASTKTRRAAPASTSTCATTAD